MKIDENTPSFSGPLPFNKVKHSGGVAKYMYEHSTEYNLDPDLSYIIGLLHDIGYLQGRTQHEEKGSLLLERINVEPKICRIISFHGTNPYSIDFSLEENKEILPQLVLLYEADMSVDAEGFNVGFDGRLKDIASRYGKNSEAYNNCLLEISFVQEYKKNKILK